MLPGILLFLTISLIIANLYYFFTNKTFKKSYFNLPLFLQLFFNLTGVAIGFAFLYQVLSLNNIVIRTGSPSGEPIEQSFLNYLYYSGVTLLSIGYGDFVPVGSARFFSVVEAAIGVLLPSAYFIKAMGSQNNEHDTKNE